jgi:hypothetical protein
MLITNDGLSLKAQKDVYFKNIQKIKSEVRVPAGLFQMTGRSSDSTLRRILYLSISAQADAV